MLFLLEARIVGCDALGGMNIDEFFGRLEGVFETLQVGPLAVGHVVKGADGLPFAKRRRRPSDPEWRQQISAAEHSAD